METKAILHVAFNKSVGGSVTEALKMIGRNERVIGLSDNLSFGPIDVVSSNSRAEWIKNVAYFEFAEVIQESELFWREAVSDDGHAIVWVCLHNAAEYYGFLEFIWRIGKTAFSIIDATGLELTDRLNRNGRHGVSASYRPIKCSKPD